MTSEELIATHRRLDQELKALKKRHEAEQKQYKDLMAQIQGIVHSKLLCDGAQSIRTDAGTAAFYTVKRVKIKDWTEVTQFITEHNLLHFLQRRLTDSEVVKYVEEAGSDVPGTEIETFVEVRFRSPTK